MHEFEIATEKHAEILYEVLRHEIAPRCRVEFKLDNKKFVIRIRAKSISNLRAAANSFLKWIDMVEKIMEGI